MTPGLFFILTYPTYDPIWSSVNFTLNFLNFHSDALLCHLIFFVVGQLYSIQYKIIFGTPDKIRRDTGDQVRPLSQV
jgi:hypothetical protein